MIVRLDLVVCMAPERRAASLVYGAWNMRWKSGTVECTDWGKAAHLSLMPPCQMITSTHSTRTFRLCGSASAADLGGLLGV